jgi:hypothetical protein
MTLWSISARIAAPRAIAALTTSSSIKVNPGEVLLEVQWFTN